MKYIQPYILLLIATVSINLMGCAVPQKPGNGMCTRLVEPETNTGYWLYLPEDYVKSNGQHANGERWPIVITFHGLKPYDNAGPQIREWQEEADRYGFIVIAPELRTCDSLYMQYPLRDPTLSYVQKDEKAIIAIMDEVYRRTNGDPNRVLATSFSSGGYMAHYIVNRYPKRFSCLAVRGSNFSAEMLDPLQIPQYRDMNIGIFFGENDFKDCRVQSMEAVNWYRQRNFDVVAREVKGLGHERRPQVAASFFASTIGAVPKTPPELGQMVMRDVIPEDSRVRLSSRTKRPPISNYELQSNPSLAQNSQTNNNTIYNPSPPVPAYQTTSQRPTQVTPKHSVNRTPPTYRSTPNQSVTPKRPARQPYVSIHRPAPRIKKRDPGVLVPKREYKEPPAIPAQIHSEGEKVGNAPLSVHLSIQIPQKLREGASILWTANDRPFGKGSFQANRILKKPGEYVIEAHITTADDQKIHLRETFNVLAPPASQPASS